MLPTSLKAFSPVPLFAGTMALLTQCFVVIVCNKAISYGPWGESSFGARARHNRTKPLTHAFIIVLVKFQDIW
jgi:hypothetical protein